VVVDTRGERDAGTWFCNLFYIAGRKCLIFTHGATLTTVIAARIRATDIRQLGETFRRVAAHTLARTEGLTSAELELLFGPGPDQIAATTGKSTLGVMNEHVFTCRFCESLDGTFDAIAMSARLNSNLVSPLGDGRSHYSYGTATDHLQSFLGRHPQRRIN
jgi:hypothetical protein